MSANFKTEIGALLSQITSNNTLVTPTLSLYEVFNLQTRQINFSNNWNFNSNCGSQVLIVGMRGTTLLTNTTIQSRQAFNQEIYNLLAQKFSLQNVEYEYQSCPLIKIIDPEINSLIFIQSISVLGIEIIGEGGASNGLLFDIEKQYEFQSQSLGVDFNGLYLANSSFVSTSRNPVLKISSQFQSFNCTNCTFTNISLNSSSLIGFQEEVGKVQIFNLTLKNSQLDGYSTALDFKCSTAQSLNLNHIQLNSISLLNSQSALVKIPTSGISIQIANLTLSGASNLQVLSLPIISLTGDSNIISFEQVSFTVDSSLSTFIHVSGQLNSISIIQSHFSGVAFTPHISSTQSLIYLFTVGNNIEVERTSFLNLQNLVSEGAIYHLNGGNLIQSFNSYTNISSFRAGGVYYAEGQSSLQISNNIYTGCLSTFGAIFYLISTATLQANHITALYCLAFNSGGVIYSAQSSQFWIQSSLFRSNRAIVEGAVIYASTQELAMSLSSSITESDIIENSSLQYVMSLHYTRIVIQNCTLLRNYPTHGQTAGIELSTATAYLRNTVISNEGVEQFIGYQYNSLGLIYVQRLGGVYATNCTFSHSRAEIGAVLFCLGWSIIEFHNCTFDKIDSIVMGGIFFSNYVRLIWMENCRITDSTTVAGALFFNQFSQNITISNTLFQNIYTTTLFDLTFSNTTFFNSTLNLITSPNGPLIQCYLCIHFEALYTKFTSLVVSSTILLRQYYQDQHFPFTVAYNYFYNITSLSSGGALSIDSVKDLTIQGNIFNLTIVTNGKGGAIISSGQGMKIVLYYNTFLLCFANEGGALMWEGTEPLGVLNNIYILNSAAEYGNNYATSPNRLTFVNQTIALIFGVITEEDISNLAEIDPKSVTIDEDVTQIQVQSFRSSGTLSPIYIAVLDQYNQIVRTATGNLYFYLTSSVQTEFTDFRAQSSYETTAGIFNLRNVRLFNEPNSFLSLSFQAILSNPSMTLSPSLKLIVEIRNCQVGEALGADGSCTVCEQGTFLLQLSGSPQVCLDCLPNAECFGGAMIAPSPGYWRPSNTSLLIYECYVKTACIGSPNPANSGIDSYSPLGNCHSNYEGRLCAQCKDGFTRNSRFQCSKCHQAWKNYLILVIIIVIVTLLFILLVRATLASSNKQKSVFTVFFKILVNHIQLMALLASFEYDWPEEISSFFDLVKPMADVSSELFSLDCFISDTGFNLFSSFYLRVLIFLFLPLFLIVVALLIWSIRYPCSKYPEVARSRTTATTLLLLFFMHPTISNLVFMCFLCRTIDNQRYLVADLSQKCWSTSTNHILFAMTAGIGGLLVWVVGVPLVALRRLSHVQQRLHTREVKQKYGFLYNGFKKEAYFWESVIMFRKIAIIFVSAILSVWGSIIQAYVLLLVLVSFTVLTIRIKPYRKRDLNQLQVLSLICSLASSYTGLYFLTSQLNSNQSNSARSYKLSSSIQWIFFVLIIGFNIYFLVMWIRLFLKSLSASLRKKYPKVYFVCVACCQKQRQIEDEQQHKRSQIEEEYLLILDQIASKVERIKGSLNRGANFVSRQNLRPQLTRLKLQAEKVNLTLLPEELDTSSKRHILKEGQQFLDSFECMVEEQDSIEVVPVLYNQIELSKFQRKGSAKISVQELNIIKKQRLRHNTDVIGSYEIPSKQYMDFEEQGHQIEYRETHLQKQISDPIQRITDSSSNLSPQMERKLRRKVIQLKEQEGIQQEGLIENIVQSKEEPQVRFQYQESSREEFQKSKHEEIKNNSLLKKLEERSPSRRKSQMRQTFGVVESFQNMEEIIQEFNSAQEEIEQPKKLKREALKYRKDSN